MREYVTEKVIKLLKENNFGYVKIDYNECMGIGCDGAESYGEGMRQHMEYVLDFMREIKRCIPGIVMEICSSGGHRLEPTFMKIADMASFSDAHEGLEGAIIAADLHRYILPRQMQIWTTLKNEYSIPRIYFTIAKGMLGRYCLSGNILGLDETRREAVDRSIPFYEKLKNPIKHGKTLIFVTDGITSLRHLPGVRYLMRTCQDGTAVLWIFGFDGEDTLSITNTAFDGYSVEDSFVYGEVQKCGSTVTIVQKEKGEVVSAVLLLKKEQ